MVGLHAFHTFDIVYKIYNPYLLVMGCSLPLLGGTGACYRYIFTNIAKIQRLFHWSYDAYISTMLHIRMDNFQ